MAGAARGAGWRPGCPDAQSGCPDAQSGAAATVTIVHRIHPPEQEAEHLLALHGGAAGATKALSLQFSVIQSRTQLLLTLATIILSITGFSGPRIAASGLVARVAMALGLGFVLAGILLALLGSMRIRWLTQFIDPDERQRLSAIIAYRNRKTLWFMWELGFVVAGLACYVAAVVWYLIHPPPL